jgi:Domain of unknown function (DUF4158)
VCTLPWLGFVPDDVASAPPAAVARLAEQLRMDPEETRSYGCRAKARTDHLRLAAQYLGWRAPTTLELKELDEFLLARAVEHDSPTLLFRPVIHNTGQNSPLVGPGAVGCSSKSRPQQPRANDERRDSSRSAAGDTLRG